MNISVESLLPFNIDGSPRKSKLTHPYNYDPFDLYSTGKESNGSAYSDRIYQWNHEKHDTLCMKHFGNKGQYWDNREVNKIQDFLRDYFDSPELVLTKITEYCNQATGYPCWLFSFYK